MAVILCDVDEVVCPLHDEWFGRWNELMGDDLTVDKCETWAVHKYVTPDADPSDIYEILHEPDLYESIREPCRGARAFVDALREDLGHRVVFSTSGNPFTWTQKFRWLQRHGFLTDDDREARRDYAPVTDKHLLRGDVMVDDGAHNLVGHDGVTFKILVDAPYNRHVDDPDIARVSNLLEAVELIADLRL